MGKFKDMLEQDIRNVFFNEDEFSGQHRFDDFVVNAIEDDDGLICKYSAEFQAMASGSHLLYVPKSELAGTKYEEPAVNMEIVYDGNLYTVNEIKDVEGVWLLFLERNL